MISVSLSETFLCPYIFWRGLYPKRELRTSDVCISASLLHQLPPKLWGLYPKGCTCTDEGCYFTSNAGLWEPTLRHLMLFFLF